MVYKKYIIRDGKRYGPYSYESKRVNGKVITKYVSQSRLISTPMVFLLGLGVVALLLVLFWFSKPSFSPDEQLTITLHNLSRGDLVSGTLRVALADDESLPADTLVEVTLGDQYRSAYLRDLLEDNASFDARYSTVPSLDLISFGLCSVPGLLNISFTSDNRILFSSATELSLRTSSLTPPTNIDDCTVPYNLTVAFPQTPSLFFSPESEEMGANFSRIVPVTGTEIADCTTQPYTITRAGTYILTHNLTATASTCIVVQVNGVTIDGQGFSIQGIPAGNFTGISFSNIKAFTLRNTHLLGFRRGVDVGVSSSELLFENSFFTNMTQYGVYGDNAVSFMTFRYNTFVGGVSSVYLRAYNMDNNEFSYNVVTDTTGIGIDFGASGSNSFIHHNLFTQGGGITTSTIGVISDNIITDVRISHGIFTTNQHIIRDNQLTNGYATGGHGIYAYSGDYLVVERNRVSHFKSTGLYFSRSIDFGILAHNYLSNNGQGIVIPGGYTYQGNTIFNNTIELNINDGVSLGGILNNTLFVDNRITRNGGKGMTIGTVSGNLTIARTTFVRNTEEGIYTTSARDIFIRDTVFDGNGRDALSLGLWGDRMPGNTTLMNITFLNSLPATSSYYDLRVNFKYGSTPRSLLDGTALTLIDTVPSSYSFTSFAGAFVFTDSVRGQVSITPSNTSAFTFTGLTLSDALRFPAPYTFALNNSAFARPGSVLTFFQTPSSGDVAQPAVLRDGQLCAECTPLSSLSTPPARFSFSQAGTYTLGRPHLLSLAVLAPLPSFNYSERQNTLSYVVTNATLPLTCTWQMTDGYGSVAAQSFDCPASGILSAPNILGVIDSGEGLSTWSLRVVDALGDSDQKTIPFRVDSSLPTIVFVAPTPSSGFVTNQTALTVNVSAFDSSLKNVTIFLTNSSGFTWTRTGNTSVFSSRFISQLDFEGAYTLRAEARDAQNNGASPLPVVITIDRTPPALSYDAPTPANGTIFARDTIDVRVVSSLDFEEASITLFLQGEGGIRQATGGYAPFEHTFTDLGDSVYTLSGRATDRAGNTALLPSRTITLDPAPRVTYLGGTTLPDSSVLNSKVVVNASVIDANLANVTFTLLNTSGVVDERVLMTAPYSVVFSALSTGRYAYTVTARDQSGGVTSLPSVNVTVSTAPLISFLSGTESTGRILSTGVLVINVSASHPLLANLSLSLFNASGLYRTAVATTVPTLSRTFTGLPDGVYSFNAMATDILNTRNITETRTVTMDRTPPLVTSLRRLQGLTIHVSASDALTGIAQGQGTLVGPEGSVQTVPLTLTSLIPSFLFTLPQTEGDYILNYTLTDGANNSVHGVYAFGMYLSSIDVQGTFTDSFGSSLPLKVDFLKPGTEFTLASTCGSEYTLQDGELHPRPYDLRFTLALNESALCENMVPTSVGGSGGGGSGSSRRSGSVSITLTNYTLTPGVLEPRPELLLAAPVPLYKTLLGTAVATSFEGPASLEIAYAPALSSRELSALPNESYLTVHRCAEWNFTTHQCAGAFTLYPSFTLDTQAHVATLTTSGFSAYVVTEYTCGNDICSSAYGESADSCPRDCSSSSAPVSSPQLGGGGGGGGGGGSRSSSAGIVVVQPTSLVETLAQGMPHTDTLTITNGKAQVHTFTLTANGSASALLSGFTNRSFTLAPGASETISLTFVGAKTGFFEGTLLLSDGKETRDIPVTLLVQSTLPRLLDIVLSSTPDRLAPGETGTVGIKLFNLGQTTNYSLHVVLSLMDDATNESVFTRTLSTTIDRVQTLTETFTLPDTLPVGSYTLRAVASAPQLSSVSASLPLIVAISSSFSSLLTYLPLFMTVVVVLFILIILCYYYFSLRQKLFLKRMEEKRKNSIYPFPDFTTLPKSKYAYIGMIADAEEKTYLDHTQLNRHTLIAGGTGSGKTIAGMVIVEELLAKGQSVIVFDPVGQWTGFCNKNEDPAMKKLYSSFGLHGSRAYDAHIFAITRETLHVDLVPYLHRKGLTVFTLDGLTPQEADYFIEECLERIYRAKLSETGSLKTLLVLDEVHRLLPKYGGRRAYVKLEQAVREFRKWGIGLLMVSQVLTDFKGAIRGNIGTEIQMSTRYEGDIKRVRERHGAQISQLISRLPTGLGMIESAGYNRGSPYFAQFRPILHSPYKLQDDALRTALMKDANSLKLGVKLLDVREPIARKPVSEENKQPVARELVNVVKPASVLSTPVKPVMPAKTAEAISPRPSIQQPPAPVADKPHLLGRLKGLFSRSSSPAEPAKQKPIESSSDAISKLKSKVV